VRYLILALLITGCGTDFFRGKQGKDGKSTDGSSCIAERLSDEDGYGMANYITCDDGTTVRIADGSNGSDGKDGQSTTGAAGTQGIQGASGSQGLAGTNGTNGTNGNNGADGEDAIVALLDPCGPSPNNAVDELILVLSSGEVLAWYKNVGIVQLDYNTRYVTTDSQACRFSVNNNNQLVYGN